MYLIYTTTQFRNSTLHTSYMYNVLLLYEHRFDGNYSNLGRSVSILYSDVIIITIMPSAVLAGDFVRFCISKGRRIVIIHTHQRHFRKYQCRAHQHLGVDFVFGVVLRVNKTRVFILCQDYKFCLTKKQNTILFGQDETYYRV